MNARVARSLCGPLRAVVVTAFLAGLPGCAPAYQGAAYTLPSARPAADPPAPTSSDALPPDAGPPNAARSGAHIGARIGPSDLLEITILEAPEMNRSVRVASTGQISLPLVGEMGAAGRTPRELELALEAALRQRYIRDPHVGVQVTEMQAHGVAVVGAVARPGVFQMFEPRSLLDVVALAGGFAQNAGDAVFVLRGGAASRGADSAAGGAVEVRMTDLLEARDSRHNVTVEPGDLVRVKAAGVVYVVGDVRKPGAFPLERGARVTVLQAVALGEGLGPRAARSRARIIRTSARGERQEIPVDLGAVVAGRAADLPLEPQDVLFVPNSRTKAFATGAVDALVRMVTLRGIVF